MLNMSHRERPANPRAVRGTNVLARKIDGTRSPFQAVDPARDALDAAIEHVRMVIIVTASFCGQGVSCTERRL
jgi:hypothetical protein